MRESLTLLPGSTLNRLVRFTGFSFSLRDERRLLARGHVIAVRGNMPIANLENVENDHPDQAIYPNPHDGRRWKRRHAYAHVTNKDCHDLRCYDCPEKTGAGVRRFEEEMLGANDKQQQMPAHSQLQEHHGLQLMRVQVNDCL